MAVIPRLIARYAVVLYALCAVVGFFYVWAAFQARRRQDVALFALEREDAASQGRRSWLMVGVCVLLSLGVYSVGSFVVPNLPEEQVEQTPLTSLLFTPTAEPTEPPPTSTPAPTVTLASAPTVAPIATPLDRVPNTATPPASTGNAQGGAAAACTSAGTQVISPKNGDHLAGIVEVIGTASLPDFSFYKFEIQWPDSDQWVTVESFYEPVAGGLLGNWDTRPLAEQPGTYKFRLVVVDATGNYPEPCVISVVID